MFRFEKPFSAHRRGIELEKGKSSFGEKVKLTSLTFD